ncbi:MAG: TadE/TadG family type IV pilus assembly protein [Pirellulales bacterium]
MFPRLTRTRGRRRRGAAALEFALILPVFLTLVLGMIELGRIVMVLQSLTYASREGCRIAVLDGSTSSAVTSRVNQALGGSAITMPPATVVITPSNPSSAAYDEPVTVTVQVAYSQVSWLPTTHFVGSDAVLKASITMRRETVK